MDERQLGKVESDIEHLQGDIGEIKDKLEEKCESCLVRKIVFAIVGLVGVSVLGALLALVIKNSGALK